MQGACSTHGGDEKYIQNFVRFHVLMASKNMSSGLLCCVVL
jgi:hypothetical protein